jgi:uncharacterized protein (DUF2236 family)
MPRGVMTPFVQPPRGGLTWQLAGERLALLAWGRAILLQFAHPKVAAGVAAHSGFRAHPLAPFLRLHHTVAAMRRIVFGTPADAERAVAAIRAIHDRVHGATPGGAAYSAHDADLLLWVHATLLDSHVRVLGPVLGPFPAPALDAYCREAAPLPIALGADAAAVPRDWPSLQAYLDAQQASGVVSVGPEARTLAAHVLRPALGRLAPPLVAAAERISVGTLPPAVRAGYGVAWSDADEARLVRTLARLRALRRRLPVAVARWPEARRPGV